MKSILVTGAMGYIGSGLVKAFSGFYNITQISRNTFDLTDSQATKQWFDNKYFDIIIHTAISGGNRLKIEDSISIYNNLLMFDNLLDLQSHFGKLISFGSGAEFAANKSPYGLSKKIINTICNYTNNLYNLRLYALFDSYEDDRRFIKSNIKRYLNKENMIIHRNKYMDFIYFPDFINIVQKYLEYDNLPKTLDCVYEQKYTLMDIAKIINGLDGHRVEIEIKNLNNDTDYTGKYYNINVQHKGLVQGILETYRKLNNEKSMVCAK